MPMVHTMTPFFLTSGVVRHLDADGSGHVARWVDWHRECGLGVGWHGQPRLAKDDVVHVGRVSMGLSSGEQPAGVEVKERR